MQPKVRFQWINDMSYQEVWDLQTTYHKELVAAKLANRDLADDLKNTIQQNHHLLFCEHAPVFTLGKSGSMDHLLLTDEELANGHMEFFKINRGGDITYHGPGQITGYPIFDLDEFYNDVHKYVRMIEEAIIMTIADYGLEGMRVPEYTGVWLPPNETSGQYRKICAIGVHLSRWVSMHGFAFNVNTDLSYFDKIVPCGIIDENKSVTSLSKELGREIPLAEVGDKIIDKLSKLFGFDIMYVK